MAVFGALDTVRTQLPATRGFTLALEYVARCLDPQTDEHHRIHGLAEGDNKTIQLGDGVFAMEQVYRTKPRDEGRWEAHRACIDVQVILAGEELMEIADTRTLRVEEDHTPQRDVIFFHAPVRNDGDATGVSVSTLHAAAGFNGIFFPLDAHRPCLATGAAPAPTLVRKTVVKIPVALDGGA
ncbi:MAG: YhcH/YjgK/YiaL family protein [Opitutaceae bacterium]|jgi:YhcH/YjgK/YiaL family protein|nr:YhcH/YjgK/YiaL family protein [Opitutaceae bacterium]